MSESKEPKTLSRRPITVLLFAIVIGILGGLFFFDEKSPDRSVELAEAPRQSSPPLPDVPVTSDEETVPTITLQVENDAGPIAGAQLHILSTDRGSPTELTAGSAGVITIPQTVLDSIELGVIAAEGHAGVLWTAEQFSDRASITLESLGQLCIETTSDQEVPIDGVSVYLLPQIEQLVLTVSQIQLAWELWTEEGTDENMIERLPIDLLEKLARSEEFPIDGSFLVMPSKPTLQGTPSADGSDICFTGLPAGEYRFQVESGSAVTISPADDARPAELSPRGGLRTDSSGKFRIPDHDLSGPIEVSPGEIAQGAIEFHLGASIHGWLPLPTVGTVEATVQLSHRTLFDLNNDGVRDGGYATFERVITPNQDGTFEMSGVRHGENLLRSHWITEVDGVQHVSIALRKILIDGPGEFDLGLIEPESTPAIDGIIRKIVKKTATVLEESSPSDVQFSIRCKFAGDFGHSVETTLRSGVPFQLHGLSGTRNSFEVDLMELGTTKWIGTNYFSFDGLPPQPFEIDFIQRRTTPATVIATSPAVLRLHVYHPATQQSSSFLLPVRHEIASSGLIDLPVGECQFLAYFYRYEGSFSEQRVAVETIEVIEGSTEPIELQLSPASSLKVQVLDRSGSPKEKSQLALRLAGWGERQWVGYTDANGQITFGGIPPHSEGQFLSKGLTDATWQTGAAGSIESVIVTLP